MHWKTLGVGPKLRTILHAMLFWALLASGQITHTLADIIRFRLLMIAGG